MSKTIGTKELAEALYLLATRVDPSRETVSVPRITLLKILSEYLELDEEGRHDVGHAHYHPQLNEGGDE